MPIRSALRMIFRPPWPGLAMATCLLGVAGCGQRTTISGPRGEGESAMAIVLESSAFKPGAAIPRKYTGEGEDVSPPLAWSGIPAGTKELALICDDPDAPRPTPWVHWVLYGLRPDLTSLAEGKDGGGTEGVTDFRRPGYGGPMPPPGHGVHHYHFRLYALDAPLGLAPGATKDALLAAMKGHVLATGELVGTYERR